MKTNANDSGPLEERSSNNYYEDDANGAGLLEEVSGSTGLLEEISESTGLLEETNGSTGLLEETAFHVNKTYCPVCGNKYPASNTAFCPHCGHPRKVKKTW